MENFKSIFSSQIFWQRNECSPSNTSSQFSVHRFSDKGMNVPPQIISQFLKKFVKFVEDFQTDVEVNDKCWAEFSNII